MNAAVNDSTFGDLVGRKEAGNPRGKPQENNFRG